MLKAITHGLDPWQKKTVNSWQELQAEFERYGLLHDSGSGTFCRGQADESWKLQPSFLRAIRGAKPSHDLIVQIEMEVLANFKSKAHLFLKDEFAVDRDMTIVDWWMIMQHFGCPTRLLDWTRSPYVATYFAVASHPETDGAIFFFPSEILNNLSTRELGQGFDKTIQSLLPSFVGACAKYVAFPVKSDFSTSRLVAQQGVFTIGTNALVQHDQAIGGAFSKASAQEETRKIIVPAAQKPEFLARLEVMNITAASLFSGGDALGRSSAEQIQILIYNRLRLEA